MLRCLTIATALLIAGPAAATEWVNCSDPAGEASLDFLAGSLDVLSIVGVTISASDRVWASSTAYGPGEPIQVGQAFEDATTIRVDIMDENLAAKIAELRLFKTEEGDQLAAGGTLRIVAVGAWAVSCSGP